MPFQDFSQKKTEVKLLKGTTWHCTTKTGREHCFPRLLSPGDGGGTGRTVEMQQKEKKKKKKEPTDGGGKEGEEPLIENQS